MSIPIYNYRKIDGGMSPVMVLCKKKLFFGGCVGGSVERTILFLYLKVFLITLSCAENIDTDSFWQVNTSIHLTSLRQTDPDQRPLVLNATTVCPLDKKV